MFRSWIFLILWLSWTILWGMIASPTLILSRGHRIILIVGKIWAKVTIFLLEHICNIRSNVIGYDNIPKGPFIVAAKHQSVWETIFFLCLFDNPVFIIKKELIKIPIYGWYLDKMLMIAIDRKAGVNSLKQIKVGVDLAISHRRPVIIFPEGTRTGVASKVKLKGGIQFLHEQFQDIPIIPISLNSGLYWPNNSFIKKPGVVQLEIFKEFQYKYKFLDELEKLLHPAD